MVPKWPERKQKSLNLNLIFYLMSTDFLRISLTLVGEPMIVGRGDFCSQSEVRGEEPSSLVGEEPRLPGRLS